MGLGNVLFGRKKLKDAQAYAEQALHYKALGYRAYKIHPFGQPDRPDRGEHEDHVRWRLLQCLQHRVLRRGVH